MVQGLTTIVEHKRKELNHKKELIPIKMLETYLHFSAPTLSMSSYLNREGASGIIAEFKRKSPSAGWINRYASVETIPMGYMKSGASALSVLTDESFFGAKKDDLEQARKRNLCPILRKDFVIDAYQIFEAKAMGADTILLIAAILSKTTIQEFTQLAHDLKMEVLLEIREEEELDKRIPEVDIVGVNNRDLKVMKTSLEQSFRLASHFSSADMIISESGIRTAEDILSLRDVGFKGFLIGEHFMRQVDPVNACKSLIREVADKQNSLVSLKL